MERKYKTIDITDLPLAVVDRLNQTIDSFFWAEWKHINEDINMYWSTTPDESSEKKEMLAWRDAIKNVNT